MKSSFWPPILLAALLAVTLPYALAALAAGPGDVFAGFLFNPIDGATYLAKTRQGWAGMWRFTLPFTAEPGEGAYLFLFYLFLGHLARWTGLPLIGMFHFARLVGAGLLVLALARFFDSAMPGRRDLARLATWLAVCGSGLGWLIVFLGPLPTDFYVAEAYPFLAMFANPHFPLGLAILLEGLILLMNPGGRLRAARLAGLGLLLAVILPFGLVVALLVAALWAGWTWIEERRLEWQPVAAWGLLGGPALLYQYAAALMDPVLAGWNAQNQTPSPPLYDFLLSFSPALILAGYGAYRMVRSQAGAAGDLMTDAGRRILIAWLAAGLLLVYCPFPLQRRFLLGYYIPAAGLAVVGLDFLRRRWPARARALTGALVGLSLVTNLLLLGIAMTGVLTRAPALYLTQGESQALAWIRQETAPEALVLASPEMGRWIPAFTGRRVIYGHPFETVNAAEEEARVQAFFAGEAAIGPDGRFYGYAVDYVFYGPRDPSLRPAGLETLTPVYDAEGVQIYAVGDRP